MCIESKTNYEVRRLRIGPLQSLPGRWFEIESKNPITLFHHQEQIVSFFAGATNEELTVIGYPPLHMHHLHAVRSSARNRVFHWFQTHGDYAKKLPKDDFGLGAVSAQQGYERKLPHGYCVSMEPSSFLTLSAIINDVRSAPIHPIVFWVEYAWTLTSSYSQCKAASYLNFYPPPPYSNGYSRFAVSNRDAISWWSGTMPHTGRMLSTWTHTHRLRFRASILLAINIPQWWPWKSFGIGSVIPGTSTRGLKNFTFTYHNVVHNYADSIICEDYPNISAMYSNGRFYDRTIAIRCHSWSFVAGDPWSVIAFFSPRWELHTEYVAMHMEFHMFADLDTPVSQDAILVAEQYHMRLNRTLTGTDRTMRYILGLGTWSSTTALQASTESSASSFKVSLLCTALGFIYAVRHRCSIRQQLL